MSDVTSFEPLPEGWTITRIKNSIATSRNGIWGSDPDGYSDIRCVRVADFDRAVQRIHDNDVTYRAVTAPERRGRLLEMGNLLLEKSGGGEKSPVGFVILYDRTEPAVCSNFVARVVLRDGMDPRFWTYVHGANYAARLTSRSVKQSTGIQNLDESSYFNELHPFPPAQTQVQIADFLDRETAEIDSFIADQEELIGLLAERRAATISHAVTKGLDPTVPMKASGIEWVGDVPEHWAAGNIRRFAEMRTGHTPSRSRPEYWEACTIPWFTLADVWQLRQGRQFLGETKELISEIGLANSAADLLPVGTVVLSRTASVGFTGIMPRPMATSQDYWNWVCKSTLNATYLWFQLQAMRPHLGSVVQGSTHKTIYKADAAALAIAAPPLAEQQEISGYLEREVGELDAAMADAKAAIELSRERRAALISAAVTGKIDVRERGVA